MDVALYSEMILVHDVPDEGLSAGDIGTIVECHDVAGKETGDSLEFFEMFWNIVSVAISPGSSLQVHNCADRPAARSEATAGYY